MTSQRHKIFCRDTSCLMHEHIKKYFLMCAIKIAASHGAPLVSQTTHQFTSSLSDQSRQLLLELFLSRKSFSSSGINTPASQPCRPCRWRVAVTPFRSKLMGAALRLGLRTLASLASLRTLVVFLPRTILLEIITADCSSSF